MSNLKKSIYIDAPVEKVALYGINPKEWGHWYAHLSEPEKLVGEGEVGTVGEFKYSLLGTHLPITITVKEFNESPKEFVWIGKVDGPMAGTQKFTYTEKNGGTEVNADIEYTVPGSILGKIANLLIIEKILENSTVATLENLKAICEAM